jgi:D-apionolactonase
VRSARAFIGDRELAVGPITLKPPFNPNATGPEPKPAPGELPAAVDARQTSLFAASWLVGSLNALGNADVDALTYFETTGWRGLIERRDHPLRVGKFHSWPSMVFPVYHVLADVAEFRDGAILLVSMDDGLRVQALALRDGDRMRVLLANMTGDPIEVTLHLPGAGGADVRQLDDRSFTGAAADPRAFRESTQQVEFADSVAKVALPPFAVATLTANVATS